MIPSSNSASLTDHPRRSKSLDNTTSLSDSSNPARPQSTDAESVTKSVSQERSSSPTGKSSSSKSSLSATTASQSNNNSKTSSHAVEKSIFYPSSSVSLTPDTTIVFHEITPELSLVLLLPTIVWRNRRGLVEYNIVFFRYGIVVVFPNYHYDVSDVGTGRAYRKSAL